MPFISEVKNSNFDVKKTRDVFSKNDGSAITTEGILKGWEVLKKEIEVSGLIEMLKDLPFLIKPKVK